MIDHDDKAPHISVVTPVYGCAECLQELYDRLVTSLTPITTNFELILVNDASPDASWENIVRISMQDKRVKGINLSRNFGQHHAIAAGLDYAAGDWGVVMDCDLQDQPEEIPKLYQKAQEGYDVVFGKRAIRKDSFFKKLSSRLFYKTLSYFTDQEFDESVANFSIISSKVIKAVRSLREQKRNYRLSISWLGFKSATVNIEHAERAAGKSSYSLKKLLYLAFNVIVTQSNKPLRLAIKIGFIMSSLSLLYATYLVFRYFFTGVTVEGWTSTMVSIYFVTGILLANMGVLGLYVGKIFDEVKNRPTYVIGSTANISRDQ